MSDKWWGRIGYDREGIVVEREFETSAEAAAYAQGATDAMKEADEGCSDGEYNPLEDYWTTYSSEPSMSECEAARVKRSGKRVHNTHQAQGGAE